MMASEETPVDDTETEEVPPAPEEKVAEPPAAAPDEDDGEMTREAFDKWLEDATNCKMVASVSEPTVMKTGMLGSVTYGYKVCCPSLGSAIGVWRRYSDFAWLYDVLANRYSGTIVAPMPEKKSPTPVQNF